MFILLDLAANFFKFIKFHDSSDLPSAIVFKVLKDFGTNYIAKSNVIRLGRQFSELEHFKC